MESADPSASLQPGPATSRPGRSLLAVLALFLLASIPFLSRPLHIDDPLFFWIAQQIVKHPVDFFGFSVDWEGQLQPVNQFFQNPPLASYYLALSSRLVGWGLVGLHLSMLPISCAGLVAVFRLAARYSSRPGLVTALVAFSPAFFVSSTTLMAEPLFFCCWSWALYCWVTGSTDGSRRRVLLAGVFTVAAGWTKFSAICLVPLFVAHMFLFPTGRPVRFSQIAALVLTVLGIVAYELLYKHLYGIGAIANAIGYSARSKQAVEISFVRRLCCTSAFVGGGFIGVAVAALLSLKRRWWIAGPLIAVVFAAIVNQFLQPPAGWMAISPDTNSTGNPGPVATESAVGGYWYFLQYTLMTGGGLLILGAAIRQLIARTPAFRIHLFLSLWAAGIFVFTAFFNWSINIRTILPLAAPVAMLTVAALEKMPAPFARRALPAVILSGLITLIVANSDMEMARDIQQVPDRFVQAVHRSTALAPDAAPARLWFVSHWGFQFYMQQAGFREVDGVHPEVIPGDLVVFPVNFYGGRPGGKNLTRLARVDAGPSRIVSTENFNMGAGFYSSRGIGLPYVFGPVPPESFVVYRATPDTLIFRR